jgi:hypothetical protein
MSGMREALATGWRSIVPELWIGNTGRWYRVKYAQIGIFVSVRFVQIGFGIASLDDLVRILLSNI